MKILVEEEYGFKYWLWEVDASWNEITDLLDEKINRSFWYSSNLPSQFPDGTWEELVWEDYRELLFGEEFDAWCHLHTNEDSKYCLREEMEIHDEAE